MVRHGGLSLARNLVILFLLLFIRGVCGVLDLPELPSIADEKFARARDTRFERCS